MTTVSTIAAASNSALYAFAMPQTSAAEPDSVKVKKTDYPFEFHAEDFSIDLKDPENIKADTAI